MANANNKTTCEGPVKIYSVYSYRSLNNLRTQAIITMTEWTKNVTTLTRDFSITIVLTRSDEVTLRTDHWPNIIMAVCLQYLRVPMQERLNKAMRASWYLQTNMRNEIYQPRLAYGDFFPTHTLPAKAIRRYVLQVCTGDKHTHTCLKMQRTSVPCEANRLLTFRIQLTRQIRTKINTHLFHSMGAYAYRCAPRLTRWINTEIAHIAYHLMNLPNTHTHMP